jgi:predicted small metal-binding protein
MAKVFKCRYKGLDCEFAAYGDTTEEIIRRTYDHARTAHHCEDTLEEFGDKIRDGIRVERQSWLPWARRESNA